MKKTVLSIIVLAIVLLLSSCATLMSLLDTINTDNYNKELENLSGINEEIANEIGLVEKTPAINLGLAALVDAWAMTPVIMFIAYSGETQLPPWASIVSMTGVLGGIPASFVCSGISLSSSFRFSPMADIERYKAKLLQQQKELEAKNQEEKVRKILEETTKKAEQEFMKDPTQCPLLIEKITIIRETYYYKIRLTIRNISPWRVTAFKVRISSWTVFGDRIHLAVGSEDIIGLSQNLYFPPASSEYFTWETYADGLNKVEAEILQVMYGDGTQWPR